MMFYSPCAMNGFDDAQLHILFMVGRREQPLVLCCLCPYVGQKA